MCCCVLDEPLYHSTGQCVLSERDAEERDTEEAHYSF